MKPIGLTLCSKCVDEIDWFKSMVELDGTHDDRGGQKMIKCSNMEKKKEKNKMFGLKAKLCARAFCFDGQYPNRVCDRVHNR
jgi:hypothetical protein